MGPTKKTTMSSDCSCITTTKKRIVYWTKKAVLFNIRLIALVGLFMLSTSYQGHRKELLLMENEMFLPALKDHMTDFFRQMPDAGSHAMRQFKPENNTFIKRFLFKTKL